jgi:hypothetical protein
LSFFGPSPDISIFRNAQKVYLFGCFSISDISALQNVPYLCIIYCNGIKDYSCLVSQQYLEIGATDKLLDEHVDCFGKVRCLKIDNCSRITRINRLTHNRFLEIGNCKALFHVVLNRVDYFNVKLTRCPELMIVSITGWVYSLVIHCCNSALSHVSQNYTCLDFVQFNVFLRH